MPYQKTKEGRLVNEITLGDGYPLSNDKQPLKVGGEASIINVSSPTPDGSVDGEVEVKGKLKAKDTVIQGDLKVFSDSDTYPQFVLQSKAGTQCQLRVQAAANSSSYVRIQNNQGYWKINKPASNTKLTFTNDTNTPLTLDGNTATFAGDVTVDTDTLHVDSSNNRVGIGTTSPQSALHVEEGDIRIDTAQNGTQALRFSDRNGTEGQLQYNSQYLKLRMLTDAADGTDTKRLTVLGGQDATAVGIGTDDPTTTLDVEGTVSYKHISLTDSSDDLDVSGCTVVECTPSGNISIGGFSGGVQGQVIHVLKVDSGAGRVFIEHNEATGTQKIFTSGGSDIGITQRGGVTCYCTGSEWIVLDK